jgi:hypothetical protein
MYIRSLTEDVQPKPCAGKKMQHQEVTTLQSLPALRPLESCNHPFPAGGFDCFALSVRKMIHFVQAIPVGSVFLCGFSRTTLVNEKKRTKNFRISGVT